MAHHKRRKRYGSLMRIGFGLSNPLKSLPTTVSTKDTLIGAAIGSAGALASRYVWNNFLPATFTGGAMATNADGSPTNSLAFYLNEYLQPVGALAAGLLAFFLGKKSARAGSHLVGAGAVAAATLVIPLVQNYTGSMFKGLQLVKLGRAYRALIVSDKDRPSMRGIVLPVRSAAPTHAGAAHPQQQMRGVVVQMKRPA